jgi:hypothetical protein
MARDPEFSPAALQDRVVLGAEQADRVRLHGALTATLNLYPRSYACAWIWAPALDRLEGAARGRAREAMNAHLLRAWQRQDVA